MTSDDIFSPCLFGHPVVFFNCPLKVDSSFAFGLRLPVCVHNLIHFLTPHSKCSLLPIGLYQYVTLGSSCSGTLSTLLFCRHLKACLCPRAFAQALPLACSVLPQIPSRLGAPSLDLDFLSKFRSLLTPLYTVTSESHSSRYPFIDFFLTIAWLIVCCSCTDPFWWGKKYIKTKHIQVVSEFFG